MKPKMFVGYVEQPGIVDVQYMAQNMGRKNASGIIVYRKPPADNVMDMAKQRGVPLLQAENLTAKIKELEAHYKKEGYSVKIRDLTEVRNLMRDVC
jgi:hypothetical protein